MTPQRIEENLRAALHPQKHSTCSVFSVKSQLVCSVNKVSELIGTKEAGGERPCPKIRSVVSTSSQRDAELTFSFPL